MFDGIINFFKKLGKKEQTTVKSKDAAKERLHLVLMQDRANVSADFLDLMKQEIIEVIKKYIDVDENAIDVRLTNKANVDGTTGAPALYANIPIVSIKEEVKNKIERKSNSEEGNIKEKEDNNKEEASENKEEINVNEKTLNSTTEEKTLEINNENENDNNNIEVNNELENKEENIQNKENITNNSNETEANNQNEEQNNSNNK